jgi:hypothetical protein
LLTYGEAGADAIDAAWVNPSSMAPSHIWEARFFPSETVSQSCLFTISGSEAEVPQRIRVLRSQTDNYESRTSLDVLAN